MDTKEKLKIKEEMEIKKMFETKTIRVHQRSKRFIEIIIACTATTAIQAIS